MKFVKVLILSLATVMFVSTLALAGGGTVTKMDDKGMSTVKMDDGKEMMGMHVTGAKVGDKVECMEKDGKMSCMKGMMKK